MSRILRIAVILLLLVMCGVGEASAANPRKKMKKQESVSTSVTVTMGPDRLPPHAVKDRVMRVSQPSLEMNICPINFTIDHTDRNREGIDVSHYQGHIDWPRVSKEGGVCFVYIKATEGAELVDNMHAVNLAAARRAGLLVGSYHFYRPKAGVRQQFDNMTSVVIKSGQDLVPIIDIEDARGVSEEKFINDLTEFIRMVTRHYGKKPLLYTGQNFYNKHFVGRFTDYQWMIAKYQDEMPILNDNLPYAIWQYTAKGRVSGVKGNVDRSCLMGGATLKKLMLK